MNASFIEGFVIQSKEDFKSTNKSLLTVVYQREIKKTDFA